MKALCIKNQDQLNLVKGRIYEVHENPFSYAPLMIKYTIYRKPENPIPAGLSSDLFNEHFLDIKIVRKLKLQKINESIVL